MEEQQVEKAATIENTTDHDDEGSTDRDLQETKRRRPKPRHQPRPSLAPMSKNCARKTASTGNGHKSADQLRAAGSTPSWCAPPAGSPTRPTCRSTNLTSTTPTPWPPPSTTYWPASHTSRPAGRPVKSGREPHLRPRVALTLPHFCANEPDRREHG